MVFVNGSQITFNFVENDTDLIKYKGIEWDVLFIDEASDLTEKQIVYLKTRVRTTRKDFYTRVYLLTNPTGVSQGYLKKRYIDGKQPYKLYVTPETEGKEEVKYLSFIPARLTDNPHIMENDPNYINSLMELPEQERKALLLGDWETKSGVFFPEWSDKHIERDLEGNEIDYTPQAEDELYMSIDWGSSKPSAVLWYAVDRNRRVHVYRELYTMAPREPDTGVNMTAEELANKILNLTPYIENIKYCVIDNSTCSQLGGGYSVLEMIQEVFLKRNIPIIKSSKGRANGLQGIRKYLAFSKIDNLPFLLVSKSCFNFLRTIPFIVYDKNDSSDTDCRAEDHCFIGETLISTINGDKQIKDIVEGDLVLTRNGYKKVVKKWNNGKKEVFNYKLNNKSFTCTKNHKIYLNEGFYEINSIKIDDEIQMIFKKERLLSISIEKLQDVQTVYDLTVEGSHEYFANGILVHNCLDSLMYFTNSRPIPRHVQENDSVKFGSFKYFDEL